MDAQISTFTPGGFFVRVSVDGDTPGDLLASVGAMVKLLTEAGWTPDKPTLPDGEVEAVATVIRRFINGADVIDFYPEWRGSYGKLKIGSIYLDTDEDKALFHAQSGLRHDEIPLYPSQVALQRTQGQSSEYEVPVKKSFRLRKTPMIDKDGTPILHSSGHRRYNYTYATPVPANITPFPQQQATPSQAPEPQASNAKKPNALAMLTDWTIPTAIAAVAATDETEQWLIKALDNALPALYAGRPDDMPKIRTRDDWTYTTVKAIAACIAARNEYKTDVAVEEASKSTQAWKTELVNTVKSICNQQSF